jgi:ABC-2 type transport system ATP-binding protein
VVVLRAGEVAADGTVNALRSGVAGGRLTFRTDEPVELETLRKLPGVLTAVRQDGTYVLTTSDNDATLPELYRTVSGVRGLGVVSASLEDAVVQLFGKEG